MDELLRDDRALFERYALNDAIIAAKYLDLTWSALEKNFAIGDHKPTLGSVGVEMIKREVANLGLTPDDYFGYRARGAKAPLPRRARRHLAIRQQRLPRRPQRGVLARPHARGRGALRPRYEGRVHDRNGDAADTRLAVGGAGDAHRAARRRRSGDDLRPRPVRLPRSDAFPVPARQGRRARIGLSAARHELVHRARDCRRSQAGRRSPRRGRLARRVD